MKSIEEQFDYAGNCMNELLDQLNEDDELNAGAVLGGALTALVFRIIVSSPDSSTAIGMITTAMASGARIAAEYEEFEEELNDDGVRH